ncbi:Methyltransf_25 domain-containing protein [Nitrospina watsonii]|uniref:Methyltransf_25 domain-containing protein n=2 Tax=Nitrospina watsonii TaxID=1323948 RepID=A0ABM9HBN0_9BACT|nr:Methyltransf_25 domain-containing protein [Nitrospina watsonii]
MLVFQLLGRARGVPILQIMSAKDKEKWDAKYEAKECLAGRAPCEWLVEQAPRLTGGGKALDIAMGEGRNALYLAQRGYDVTGIDVSDIAIDRAHRLAEEKNLNIQGIVADLDHYEVAENAYDVIVCFYFLDRNLFDAIRRGLRPGGLLIYETFNEDYLKYSQFKPDWVLAPNELLQRFGDWHILNYREWDDPENEKAVTSLVARKRKQE